MLIIGLIKIIGKSVVAAVVFTVEVKHLIKLL